MNNLSEIYGIGFPNKGAELMLAAVVSKLTELGVKKENLCCARGIAGSAGIETIAGLGIKEVLHLPRVSKKNNRKLTKLIPSSILQRYGYVSQDSVYNIIDASGFAHSDQWGPKVQKRYVEKFRACRDKGGKVIMLPQALGPFQNDEIINNMRGLMNHVDVVFARDESSANWLAKAGADSKLGGVFPDFTNLVEGYKCDSDKRFNNSFVIIPNYRILDKGDEGAATTYISMLSKLIEILLSKKIEVVVFNHEGKQDLEICNKLIELFPSATLVTEDNPLRIKGILSQFRMGFSSRFHGVVSLLSQGVPTLCLGWSHKYKELYKSYKAEEMLIDENRMIESMEASLNILLSNEEKIRAVLQEESLRNKFQSNLMWNKVSNILSL